MCGSVLCVCVWWFFYVCWFLFFLWGCGKLGLNFPPPLIRRLPEIVRTSLIYWSNASMQPWAVYRDKEQNVFKILIIYSKKVLVLIKLYLLWYCAKVGSSRMENLASYSAVCEAENNVLGLMLGFACTGILYCKQCSAVQVSQIVWIFALMGCYRHTDMWKHRQFLFYLKVFGNSEFRRVSLNVSTIKAGITTT